MTQVFADSSYYLALLNPRDEYHEQAADLAAATRAKLVTTTWVLVEVANALRTPPLRTMVCAFLRELQADSGVAIVPVSQRLFATGVTRAGR